MVCSLPSIYPGFNSFTASYDQVLLLLSSFTILLLLSRFFYYYFFFLLLLSTILLLLYGFTITVIYYQVLLYHFTTWNSATKRVSGENIISALNQSEEHTCT